MAAPNIRPIRNCLYGRHIECTRRHSYQPASRALAFRRGALDRAARAHIVERTSDLGCNTLDFMMIWASEWPSG